MNTQALGAAGAVDKPAPRDAGSAPRAKAVAVSRFLPRALMAPAVLTLFLWMIVPLVMTIYFSLIRYNLMQPENVGFIGLLNYRFFVTDPSFATAVMNTLLLLGSVIAITVVGGVGLALLIDAPFPGRAGGPERAGRSRAGARRPRRGRGVSRRSIAASPRSRGAP